MGSEFYVPDSLRAAGREMRRHLRTPVEKLSHEDFIRVWCSLAYLFPGLHPDGFEHPDSGWPDRLKVFAREAWRRADAGELSDEQLYPCDAAWSGICDQLSSLTDQEAERRAGLAAEFGDSANA